MSMKRALVPAVAVLLLAACGGEPAPEAASSSAASTTAAQAPIERVFETTQVTENGQTRELADGSTLLLSFGAISVVASAGCNTLSGTAAYDGGILAVEEPMASTMMACPEAMMDQDTWVADFLTSGPTWSLDGQTLTLASPTIEMTLTENFANVAQPEPTEAAAVIGNTYLASSVVRDGTDVALAEESELEVVFEQGSVTVRAGCNTLMGPVALAGGVVLIEEMASTKMACSPALMEQDAWLTEFFTSQPTWAMEGETVVLANETTTIRLDPKGAAAS